MFGVLIRAAEADAIASRTRSVEIGMGGHSLLYPYFPLKVEGETFSSTESPMRPASSSRLSIDHRMSDAPRRSIPILIDTVVSDTSTCDTFARKHAASRQRDDLRRERGGGISSSTR
eukprot:scaffold5406_cov129-Isochrysis_galbana.AAC.4